MKSQQTVIGPDRVALITGGSSGIGLAVAKLLAQQGSHVWIAARGEEPLAAARGEVQAAIRTDSQIVGATRMDVSDAAQAAGLVDEVRGRVGVPDLVINSAGVARPGYFHKVDPQDFRWMMDINYFGAVNTIRAVVPAMIERGSGHIVNISSGVFFLPVFGYTAYGASKFALTGLSEILRAEMKAHGIRVSVVFPPNVDTPQLAYESQFRPPEARALMALDPILSPEVSPERMAAAILRGIKRGKFAIFASPADSLFYRVSRLLGGVAFLIMDRMSARAPKSESSR